MHKYQPRIHIVKKSDTTPAQGPSTLEGELHRTFVFPECVFIAVTAYQNQLVSDVLSLYLSLPRKGRCRVFWRRYTCHPTLTRAVRWCNG